MQYKTNRMSQCRDISRKPDFEPNLGLNNPNFGPRFFVQQNEPPLVVQYHWQYQAIGMCTIREIV